MIQAVQFATVNVADQTRAKAFYTEKLGFDTVMDAAMNPDDPEGPRWIMLRPSAGAHTQVVLFANPDAINPDFLAGVVWQCDDIVTTVADLEAKGVEIVTQPTPEHWGMWAEIRDSEGNRFGLGEGGSDE